MYGLVLEGGGTRGAYEIGVYKALLEEKIEISGITGTSIGAINGAMFVQGDFDICEKLWKNLTPSMILDVEDDSFQNIYNMDLKMENLKYIFEKIGDIIKNRGLDITPLKKILNHYIDEDKVRKSNKDFGIVTYNLTDMRPKELFIEDIPQGKLIDYIIASASMPVFKTEKLDGDYYIDGAFHDNLPFEMLESKGYEKLILVRVYGLGVVKKINDKHILISPNEDLGTMLDFDTKKINYNIDLGYYDTLKVFRNLIGYKFYIKDEISEESVFQYFSNIEDEKIITLADLLNTPLKKSLKKMLFQDILPKLDSLLDIKESSYKELFIRLIEEKANYIDLEKFKIYSLVEIYNAVISKDINFHEEENGIINTIIDKIEQITVINKELAILKAANIIFKF